MTAREGASRRKRSEPARPAPPPAPPKANGTKPVTWPADRIRRLNVAQLFPYARNARLHTNAQVDQLAASIKRFGFTNPVIVAVNGEIIAGHGRIMAARRLGLEEVPGVIIHDDEWTEDDKRAYRIWDNQSALMSEWSPEMLRVELQQLKASDYALELTGFSADALVEFMANPNPQSPGQFPAVGADIATEHSCPRCGYAWSGKADAAPRPAAPQAKT